MICVLDACALIAYLRNESGADYVSNLLADPVNQSAIHAINLCEVYYDFIRSASEARAQLAVNRIYALGIIVRDDLDTPFWQDVGRLKVAHRISLADCFAVAMTHRMGGTLVTSDHHEFDPLARAGICLITFIR